MFYCCCANALRLNAVFVCVFSIAFKEGMFSRIKHMFGGDITNRCDNRTGELSLKKYNLMKIIKFFLQLN